MRESDTPIVWQLDRPGRSLTAPIRQPHELKTRGVGFSTVTEPTDTRALSGQLVFHISGALAKFERNLIRERTFADKFQLARSTRYRNLGANP